MTPFLNFLTSWMGILASIITVLLFWSGAFGLGWKLGRFLLLKDKKRGLLEKRLQNVYAPMRATLLSTHIAFTSRAGDRLTDADSAEVEYGRPFPFDEIVKIASENSAVADSKLLDMIQRVSRAKEENKICAADERYINPKGGEVDPYTLIPEERELVDYIREQYELLSNKLGQNT